MNLEDDPFFLWDENPQEEEEEPDSGKWGHDEKEDPSGDGGGGGGGGGSWSGGEGGGGGGDGSGSGEGGDDEQDGEWSDEDEDDQSGDPDADAPSYENMHVPCVLLRITDPDRDFSFSRLDWPLKLELKTERLPLLKFYRKRHLARSCSGRLMLGGPCSAYPAGLLWLPERVRPVILFHFDWTRRGSFEVQVRWQRGHYDHREHGKMRIDTWGESTGMITVPVTEWKTVATVTIAENGIWVNRVRADLMANFRLLASLKK